MTDWEKYKALPDSDRELLGFRQWKSDTRMGTHSKGCWAWGPRHYECAIQEIARLKGAHIDDFVKLTDVPEMKVTT